jgi:hypothetical protein
MILTPAGVSCHRVVTPRSFATPSLAAISRFIFSLALNRLPRGVLRANQVPFRDVLRADTL